MKKLIYSFLIAIVFTAPALTAVAQTASEQTRQVSGYSGVSIGGPFKARIIVGNKESVTLNVDSEYINKVETVVENGTLAVRFKRSNLPWKKENYTIKIAEVTVYVKTLSAVANTGSGNTTIEGPVTASDFKLILSGSGSVNAPSVKVSNGITTRLSGSGSINVSGSSASASILVSGSGEVKASGFTTQDANITVSGSGSVYIKADKTLTATLIGAGNVVYTGNAQVVKHKIGSGTVKKAE